MNKTVLLILACLTLYSTQATCGPFQDFWDSHTPNFLEREINYSFPDSSEVKTATWNKDEEALELTMVDESLILFDGVRVLENKCYNDETEKSYKFKSKHFSHFLFFVLTRGNRVLAIRENGEFSQYKRDSLKTFKNDFRVCTDATN